MRIPKRLQAACLIFALSAAAWSQELPIPLRDALKRADIPPEATAVYVQEAGGGPLLIAHNDKAPFSPASVMKLVTSDAALELLGPVFTWKTRAFADGQQNGDVLEGDLIIKGGGDPKLVLENFWLFLRRVRARGIREIRGNLLLDRSAFEQTVFDPAVFDGDPMKPYNVGPDALLVNYKALAVRIVPDAAGRNVAISVDPPFINYPVAAPRLSNGECGDWRAKLKATFDASGARFAGVYPASCGERIWYVHPWQMTHTQYFDLLFRRMWMELGGVFKGEVRDGAVPASARLVAEWESAALSEVIRDINKFSNNVMARQLLLTMAAQLTTQPGNPANGAAIVRTWLAGKGIDAPELVIENGSGLSRNERVAASTMGRLLDAAFRSPVMPEFMASMPLAGNDGTMRSRVKERSVAGHAHIKTGMLNDVRAIAGYVLAASGKRYAVVCFVNHANAGRAIEMQDMLLQWVYERG